ncbi:hypothetical protein MAM1_1142d11478 [Mucor ambiguus]|uniref:Uncharacterized protein n=1 Tax=Mucor ambiguus TaxID=91626 RepID=A0A0C9LZC6_9FUNG|nr:hypothetical protein MAM1_1142d11478 [Mucor ambiguus]
MMLSLGARYCCCNCCSLAVLAMPSLGNLVLASAICCRLFAVLVPSTTAAAFHLLSLSRWCTLFLVFASAAAVAHLLS